MSVLELIKYLLEQPLDAAVYIGKGIGPLDLDRTRRFRNQEGATFVTLAPSKARPI